MKEFMYELNRLRDEKGAQGGILVQNGNIGKRSARGEDPPSPRRGDHGA